MGNARQAPPSSAGFIGKLFALLPEKALSILKKGIDMRKITPIAMLAILCVTGSQIYAQSSPQNQGSGPVAGKSSLGVTVTQMDAIVDGWSAKRGILNKPVYNDQNQRIGKIDDIIITPDSSISFAIIGAGGFLGVGKHDVAIPVEQIQLDNNNRFVLPGATKQALKDLPKFEYARKK